MLPPVLRLLLDTNTFLWQTSDNPHLPIAWRPIINDQKNEVSISVATLWEIVIKVSLGKLDIGYPLTEFFDRALSGTNITVLPITLPHLSELRYLPLHHRDPFDRLIIAQAISEDLTVVTSDAMFRKYDGLLLL